ncbi:MAG: FtsQ-type POTRA domain-containing protein [Deltaproteobacteria bacterium]|nr:FtsQ-type POTRA domain-containing protein [Deltaproteobacteria bacterium]
MNSAAAREHTPSKIPAQRARTSPRFALPGALTRDVRWTPLRIAKAVALLAVGVGSAMGVVQVRAFVERSPDLAIHDIVVTGLHADDPRAAEVLAYAAVEQGTPLFAVDPDVVAARVTRHPYVATATVTRTALDRVEIAVVERTPVASLRLSDGVFLVDEDGVLMKRARPGDAVDAPLLSLLPAKPAVVEPDAAALTTTTPATLPPRLIEALQVIRAAEAVGLSDRVSEVIELPTVGFELMLEDGARARLGNDLFETKLRRLLATEEKLRAQGRRFSFMYLDDARHPERVAVRLRPATETTRAGG